MSRSFSLSAITLFGLMLGVAPAWADVDISEKNRVEVSDWGELKSAVESADKDTVIVLKGDITADANKPITSVGNTGVVIDGGDHTITGQEGSSNGQFINFDSSDKTDLIIQNVKFEGLTNKNPYGGVIYNSGKLGSLYADFSNNYVKSDSDSAQGGGFIM